MAKKPERRRQIVDPAVADILGSDRRLKKEARSSEPEPAATPPGKSSPAPKSTASGRDRSAPKTNSQKRDTRDKPMTYRIGEAVIDRINEAADRFNVEKSSLVKFLLTDALHRLETGQLMLPLDEKPRKLDI